MITWQIVGMRWDAGYHIFNSIFMTSVMEKTIIFTIGQEACDRLLNRDPVMKEQRIDAICCIPCNDCDSKYIGQTKRQFVIRLKEHQKAVFCCKKESSALL